MISVPICSEQTGRVKITPNTGHAGDLGDARLQGPRWSTCLNLPRDLVLGRLSCLNLLGDPPVQGSQEVDMPRPAQGFDLQEAVMPEPAWGSAPWPGGALL